MPKGNAERVHPERSRVNGIAQRDVTRDAFVEALFGEDAKRSGQTALEILALLVFVGEDGGFGEGGNGDESVYQVGGVVFDNSICGRWRRHYAGLRRCLCFGITEPVLILARYLCLLYSRRALEDEVRSQEQPVIKHL